MGRSSRSSNNKSRMTSLSCMYLVAVLLGCYFGHGMAVDRSKFRTCKSTSFCRRHRENASERLYKYRLVSDSITFHSPEKVEGESGGINKAAEEAAAAATSDKASEEESASSSSSSMWWRSLQERLIGSGSSADDNDEMVGSEKRPDPLSRMEPTLSGLLINTALETSTGQHEELIWSVYAMNDGMIRMRITEVYGKDGTAYVKPRVTYDHLVLDKDSMKPADYANWVLSPTTKKKATDGSSSVGASISVELLAQIIQAMDKEQTVQNYIAVEYGDGDDNSNDNNMLLLVRLDPFAIYLYRKNDLENKNVAPIIALGEKGQTHFEIRRFKEDETKKDDKEDKDLDTEEDEEGDDENTKKEEKEIVGYWEDGLAIYADGTREEKKKENDDTDTANHRKLSEVSENELDRTDLWEEKFQSHVDSKPFGPMSVGMDISFPKSNHLFGLPEHASSTVLKTTVGENSHYKEPYRLYNLDVFEYELDETMALYGHVPLVVSQSISTGTTGVFWYNPTETFVDVATTTNNDNDDENNDDTKTTTTTTTTTTHFVSESGIIDVLLLPGPNPQKFYAQYAQLTGFMPLPPMFSLGYHQCRWNYKDESDVYYVHHRFEEYDYPYDVLWLDIEHTDGKRYFTWDKNLFPDPIHMQQTLALQGRKMVTIIDPHIKRDDNYYVHKKATSKGLYIKDKSGKNDYDGWCWPGSSSYLDFTNHNVRKWWASQFDYNKYVGSTSTLYTWNDMNEPSVFNGPEVSMQKDLLNLNGEEHREWHNLYGMLFHRATMEGLIKRNLISAPPPIPEEDARTVVSTSNIMNTEKTKRLRPFVLSRSFFAGSQKYGAIWTGDNKADWSHLQVAAPMLLSMNVAALSFVGADVGGFFGNPDAELFIRWMQAGAYQPFFRGHAHHDSKRREPWTYDDDDKNKSYEKSDGGYPVLIKLRKAAMTRYALLPFWYTIFREAGVTGMPVMRTMWMQYPNVEALFAVDDQYMIGSDLLVKPVTAPGVTESQVQFPTDDIWYDVESLLLVSSSSKTSVVGVEKITVPSDIDTIPVFQRGGSVIPRKLRLRRSAQLMKTDPYTLYIALDDNKKATGTLYMDDEESFDYAKGNFAEAVFSADFAVAAGSGTVSNSVTVGLGWMDYVNLGNYNKERMIERIVIMGVGVPPKEISTTVDGKKITIGFTYNEPSKTLVLRKPDLSAISDWEIMLA